MNAKVGGLAADRSECRNAHCVEAGIVAAEGAVQVGGEKLEFRHRGECEVDIAESGIGLVKSQGVDA